MEKNVNLNTYPLWKKITITRKEIMGPLSDLKKKSRPSDSVIPIHSDPVLTAYFQSVFAYFGNKEKPPTSLLELKFKELILNIVSSRGNELLSGLSLIVVRGKQNMHARNYGA